MRKIVIALLLAVVAPLAALSQVTLQECLDRAEENYPLIKRYAIVEKTLDVELSDINRGWLPRVGVYAQATAQNNVPAFPEALKSAIAQMGQEMKGLGHVQYKAGVEISQTIWDGGASRNRREIERLTAEESKAATDVQIYAVREKVIGLFFGILLMDDQIAQTENTIALLKANRDVMEAMERGGVAMLSDVDMLEAQVLTMNQQLAEARSAVKGYRSLLSVYTGIEIGDRELVRPDAAMPANLESARPELALFDARQKLNAARSEAVDATLMPRAGFFAQAIYGYPGLNYFKSMAERRMALDLLAGVRISWDIDAFYTRGNSLKKIALADESNASDRELFLFNSRLQTTSQTEAIEGLRAVMADDDRIVELRSRVRRAAESQLANGVIDATALLAKITDENLARLTASYHRISYIQNIYQLKNTLNR